MRYAVVEPADDKQAVRNVVANAVNPLDSTRIIRQLWMLRHPSNSICVEYSNFRLLVWGSGK